MMKIQLLSFVDCPLFSDILEHCGPDSVPFKEMFVKVISESVTSANASIRQICTNAIGMAAQYGGDGYAEFCLSLLEPMFKMAMVPDARADENVYATENCVSAIAKFATDFQVLFQTWIVLLTNGFHCCQLFKTNQQLHLHTCF